MSPLELRPAGDERPPSNLLATFARHPPFVERWRPLTELFLAGTLPARDRELLILRTAWRCRCDYVWGHHQPIAQAADMTTAEIDRLMLTDTSTLWTDHERAVIDAADQLHDEAWISDRTWAVLAESFDDQQLIEVPMVVGHYHSISFTLRSIGVQLEPAFSGFDR